MSEQKKTSEIAARNEADTGQVGAPTHEATAPNCSETRAVSGQTEKAKPPEPGQNAGPKGIEDQASKRAADVLVGLVDTAVLFHSEDQTAYADLCIYGARVTCAVISKKLESFLTQRYFETTGKAPRSDALKEAQSTLSAHAQFCSPCRKIHRRVARLDGKVYIDLGDEAWNAIEIDSSGWRVTAVAPVRFIRSSASKALPVPVREGSISPLGELLNLRTNEDFVLVVCWVLAAIALDGPFPILVVNGEQGSAKSTFSSIIRSLVDPNTASVRTLPRNEQDLFVASQHSRILAFDNLSGITPSMSDALCRVATGGAFASRKLYSDGEEVLLNACNPILLNGISGTVTRADLADRSLFIRLEPIPDPQRRPVAEVMSDFEEAYPAIFGALLDAASEGLRRIDAIPTPHLPRMADFAKLARACETALWSEGTFQKAYASNVDAAVWAMVAAACTAAPQPAHRQATKTPTSTASTPLNQSFIASSFLKLFVPRSSCYRI